MKCFMNFSMLVVAVTLSLSALAQKPSPPMTAEGTVDGVKIKINYSAPSAKGRKMIGGKEPFGSVWRTGANEATVFEIDKAAKLEGQALAAGKYEMFTIPGETEWVIIIQKYGKQWGAYDYKESNDVLRVKVKSGKPDAFVETFNIAVGADAVTLKWENTLVSFKVTKG